MLRDSYAHRATALRSATGPSSSQRWVRARGCHLSNHRGGQGVQAHPLRRRSAAQASPRSSSGPMPHGPSSAARQNEPAASQVDHVRAARRRHHHQGASSTLQRGPRNCVVGLAPRSDAFRVAELCVVVHLVRLVLSSLGNNERDREGSQMTIIDFTAQMAPVGIGALALLVVAVVGILSCLDHHEIDQLRRTARRVGAWGSRRSRRWPADYRPIEFRFLGRRLRRRPRGFLAKG